MKVIRINSYNAFCVIETPFDAVIDNRAVVKSVRRYWQKTGFTPKSGTTSSRKINFEICHGWGGRYHEVAV